MYEVKGLFLAVPEACIIDYLLCGGLDHSSALNSRWCETKRTESNSKEPGGITGSNTARIQGTSLHWSSECTDMPCIPSSLWANYVLAPFLPAPPPPCSPCYFHILLDMILIALERVPFVFRSWHPSVVFSTEFSWNLHTSFKTFIVQRKKKSLPKRLKTLIIS